VSAAGGRGGNHHVTPKCCAPAHLTPAPDHSRPIDGLCVDAENGIHPASRPSAAKADLLGSAEIAVGIVVAWTVLEVPFCLWRILLESASLMKQR